MKTNYNYKNLGAGIVLQAVKDYCTTTNNAMKKLIIKDLRSGYLYSLSGGMSIVAADQLEKNPKEIAQRLKKHKEETK